VTHDEERPAEAVPLAAGIAAGWRKRYEGPELAAGAATLSYLVAYGIGLQAILFYYLWGLDFDWYIPNLVWGFKFYTDCLQMIPTGLASAVVVIAALVGAKLAAALTRGRASTPPVDAG